jgi:hypothetical protein
MYPYWIALGLLVFPCLVEPGVVGVHAVSEYDSTSAPPFMHGADLPQQGDPTSPAGEDRPLSSSATFG